MGKDAAELVKGVSDALCVFECDMCAAAEQYVKKQLGAKGRKDFEHHSFFKSTRWDDMEAQTVPPPHVLSMTGVSILCCCVSDVSRTRERCTSFTEVCVTSRPVCHRIH